MEIQENKSKNKQMKENWTDKIAACILADTANNSSATSLATRIESMYNRYISRLCERSNNKEKTSSIFNRYDASAYDKVKKEVSAIMQEANSISSKMLVKYIRQDRTCLNVVNEIIAQGKKYELYMEKPFIEMTDEMMKRFKI